jgi:glucans biosynthesis protein
VAFWTPKRSPKAGDETSFEYRLWFFKKREDLARGGRVLATRIGVGGAGDPNPERRRVVIDFVGEKLAELNDQATVEAMVSASTGEIHNTVVQRNPFTNGWRLSFELDPQEARSVELRCYLKSGTDTLTETWSYRWTGS